MKMTKKVIVSFIIILIFSIVLCVFKISPLLGSDSIFMPGETKIEKLLNDNLEGLSYCCEYIGGLEHTYIRWDSIDENNLTCYTEIDGENEITYHIPTVNPTFSGKIKKLEDARIENITKENNYILFIRWSSLDSSCGLLYCSEELPNISEQGVEIKKLDYDDWYYYRHVYVSDKNNS